MYSSGKQEGEEDTHEAVCHLHGHLPIARQVVYSWFGVELVCSHECCGVICDFCGPTDYLLFPV